MADTKVNIHVKGVPHTIYGVTITPDGRAAISICCYNKAYSQKLSYACDNCMAIHTIENDGTPAKENAAEFELGEDGEIYFKPEQFTIVKSILN